MEINIKVQSQEEENLQIYRQRDPTWLQPSFTLNLEPPGITEEGDAVTSGILAPEREAHQVLKRSSVLVL